MGIQSKRAWYNTKSISVDLTTIVYHICSKSFRDNGATSSRARLELQDSIRDTFVCEVEGTVCSDGTVCEVDVVAPWFDKIGWDEMKKKFKMKEGKLKGPPSNKRRRIDY